MSSRSPTISTAGARVEVIKGWDLGLGCSHRRDWPSAAVRGAVPHCRTLHTFALSVAARVYLYMPISSASSLTRDATRMLVTAQQKLPRGLPPARAGHSGRSDRRADYMR